MGKRKSLAQDKERSKTTEENTQNSPSKEQLNSGICTDDELLQLAKEASHTAKKLKKSPKSRLSLSQSPKTKGKLVETSDVQSPKTSKKSSTKKSSPDKHHPNVTKGTSESGGSSSESENGGQSTSAAEKSKQGKVIESKKQVKHQPPEGFSLATCHTGQLFAEDLEDSDLWLVRMPAEFDVDKLQNVEPVPGASLEVKHFVKEDVPHVVEIQAVRNDSKQGPYSVLLPSRETKAPRHVGGFVGEIQVTNHVVTKPYQVEIKERKKRELPEGLKMRYVPFGAGGAVPAKQHLGEMQQSPSKSGHLKGKSEKRKKDKNLDLERPPEGQVDHDQKIDASRKKKLTGEEMTADDTVDSLGAASQDSNVSSKSKKKKKKHKRELERNQDFNSGQEFEEGLSPKKKPKIEERDDISGAKVDEMSPMEMMDSTVTSSQELPENSQSSSSSKKKKKKKKDIEKDLERMETLKSSTEDEVQVSKPKKKKKDKK